MLYRQNITKNVVIIILSHNTIVIKARSIIRENNFKTGKTDTIHTV